MILSSVEVICGPNKIAYKITNGVLQVFVGEFVKDAPKDAGFTEIKKGYTKFIMRSSSEESKSNT